MGHLYMGAPDMENSRLARESPQYSVTLPSFFMGRYAVTQEQWRIVVKNFNKVNIDLRSEPSFFQGDHLSVE